MTNSKVSTANFLSFLDDEKTTLSKSSMDFLKHCEDLADAQNVKTFVKSIKSDSNRKLVKDYVKTVNTVNYDFVCIADEDNQFKTIKKLTEIKAYIRENDVLRLLVYSRNNKGEKPVPLDSTLVSLSAVTNNIYRKNSELKSGHDTKISRNVTAWKFNYNSDAVVKQRVIRINNTALAEKIQTQKENSVKIERLNKAMVRVLKSLKTEKDAETLKNLKSERSIIIASLKEFSS